MAALEASVARLELELGDLDQLEARRAELDGELCVLYERVFADGVGDVQEEQTRSVVCALEFQVEEVSLPELPEGQSAGVR